MRASFRMSARNLIVNADDFGASEGINRGVVDCHVDGVVTSTSLMVLGRAAESAAALAREHPGLGIGLHWDLEDERQPTPVLLDDPVAVRAELERQFARFHELMGCAPTHLDSHHHVHRDPQVTPIARELAAREGVHLRNEESVRYVGGFYAQWEWKVTELKYVSVDFLTWILRNEVEEGWTELACHPGYVTRDLDSGYLHEREAEMATLTDPRIRSEIEALGIRLCTFAEVGDAGGAK